MLVQFESVKELLSSWIADEEGASLVEYVLMVALIAVVCIGAVTLLGTAAKEKFGDATKALNTANSN
jgi:pilus assembly protein Flp/PilA